MQKLLPAALGLILPVAAQGDHFSTSPAGFDAIEGTADSSLLLGTEPLLRYQQIDSTNGSKTNRDRIGFRRDGYMFDSAAFGARTIELEFVLSESDLANISTTFASNYKTNTTTVISRKYVNFADWSLAPVLPPAPIDNIVFFDSGVYWNYAGKTASGNDLLWEVKVWSNTAAGQPYPFDFDIVVPNSTFGAKIPNQATGTSLNTGCTLTGRTSAFSLSMTLLNAKSSMTMNASCSNGIGGNPVVLLIDGINQNLNLGLCTTVHALAVDIPQGTSSATGSSYLSLNLAHDPNLVGVPLYFQAATVDAGQAAGLGLTRAQSCAMPADPQDPKVGYLFARNPASPIATSGPTPGGIILGTNHF